MVLPISDDFIIKFVQLDKLQNRDIIFFLGLGRKTPICAMQGDITFM